MKREDQTYEKWLDKLKNTEAWVRLARPAGLMIGRAALRNPWIFSQLHSRFQGHPAADLTFRNVPFERSKRKK